MSEAIKFTDDAEERFWADQFKAIYPHTNATGASMYADAAVVERRKRIGTSPAVPAEVRAVLGVNQEVLKNAAFAMNDMGCDGVDDVVSHIDAIRAARAALGMDTKEQQP